VRRRAGQQNEAGVADLRWCDLRHRFASRPLMSGTDIRSVLELLGDRTVSMAITVCTPCPDAAACWGGADSREFPNRNRHHNSIGADSGNGRTS